MPNCSYSESRTTAAQRAAPLRNSEQGHLRILRHPVRRWREETSALVCRPLKSNTNPQNTVCLKGAVEVVGFC